MELFDLLRIDHFVIVVSNIEINFRLINGYNLLSEKNGSKIIDIAIIQDNEDYLLLNTYKDNFQINNTLTLILDKSVTSLPDSFVQNRFLLLSTSYPTTFPRRLPSNYFEISWKTPALIFKRLHAKINTNVLYAPDNSEDIVNASEIIKGFSSLEENYNLYVWSNLDMQSKLSPSASDRIHFINQKDIKNIKFSVAISSKRLASATIASKIPTIIVGREGFGGLVTPQNISFHIRNNFKGRIGGSESERVPFTIILAEINYSFDFNSHNNKYLDDNKLQLHRFEHEQNFKKNLTTAFDLIMKKN